MPESKVLKIHATLLIRARWGQSRKQFSKAQLFIIGRVQRNGIIFAPAAFRLWMHFVITICIANGSLKKFIHTDDVVTKFLRMLAKMQAERVSAVGD